VTLSHIPFTLYNPLPFRSLFQTFGATTVTEQLESFADVMVGRFTRVFKQHERTYWNVDILYYYGLLFIVICLCVAVWRRPNNRSGGLYCLTDRMHCV